MENLNCRNNRVREVPVAVEGMTTTEDAGEDLRYL